MKIIATTLNTFEIINDTIDMFLFPNLTTATNIIFSTVPLQTTLVFPNLTAIDNLGVTNCLGLTAIDVSQVSAFGVNFSTSGCRQLNSILFKSGAIFSTDAGTYNFSGCNLPSAIVNKILAICVASNFANCAILLQGGGNGAPTGQGIIDKQTLINNGCGVNTN